MKERIRPISSLIRSEWMRRISPPLSNSTSSKDGLRWGLWGRPGLAVDCPSLSRMFVALGLGEHSNTLCLSRNSLALERKRTFQLIKEPNRKHRANDFGTVARGKTYNKACQSSSAPRTMLLSKASGRFFPGFTGPWGTISTCRIL